MDKRKNNGGHKTAGRKSKAEEQQLIEKLSPLEKNALEEFRKAINGGEKWAIELFFKYMYGLPKQQMDLDVKQTMINWIEEKSYEENKD
jgi:hypothetical protein